MIKVLADPVSGENLLPGLQCQSSPCILTCHRAETVEASSLGSLIKGTNLGGLNPLDLISSQGPHFQVPSLGIRLQHRNGGGTHKHSVHRASSRHLQPN